MKSKRKQVKTEQPLGSKGGKQASVNNILQAYSRTSQLQDNPDSVTIQENKTGLPDTLKSGVENLSGHSLDNVKVHYNSSQPATLQAHAYAQGTEIHVAPGQEKHLPHEAWHVVQQKQGRVKPTGQLKGTTNINDDTGLENEADVMGQNALNLAIGKNHPVQRKIQISEVNKTTDQVYTHLDDQHIELKTAFEQEILSKPKAVVRKATDSDALITDFGDEGKDKARIKSWNDEDKEYKYGNDKANAEEIAKDTVKYYLYKKFDWLNIGVAAYMTGDVTGLLMATSLKDNVTLDIQKGKQVNNEAEKDWSPPDSYTHGVSPEFSKSNIAIEGVPVKDLMRHMNEAMAKKKGNKVSIPNFYTKNGENAPPTLPETFNHESLKSKVVESDVAQQGYAGTKDAYKKKFDSHSGTIKPWNKETYEATKMIGELYPGKKEEIEGMLLPENPEQNKAKLKKIDEYRESKVGGKGIILMWGRLSGLGGGAHTELDSNPVTMVQIAKKIASDFPSRTIVLIGDKVVSESILRTAGVKSSIVDINAFWGDDFFKQNAIPMGDRRYQHYLVQQMSKVNDAVSIGMRSGSLEATALLGVKTIFLDDKGNNAEGRMEFWAGDAANTRDVSNDHWETVEDQKSGNVKNYKRVATKRKTGDKVYSKHLKNILEALAKIETVPKGKITSDARVVDKVRNDAILESIKKIKGFNNIANLAAELTKIVDLTNSKAAKLEKGLLREVKNKTELRLKDLDQLEVGLTGDELNQISGLTSHLIKKDIGLTELEGFAPKKLHTEWRKLPVLKKQNVRDEVLHNPLKYPKIAKHIFHRKPHM